MAESLDPGVVAGLRGLASVSPLLAPTLLDQKSDSTVADKFESALIIIRSSSQGQ